MSTQLTGASAKMLFESPAQLNLKKKLLVEGEFDVVSSGPESATNLNKGITVVRTKQVVGTDALTDEPIYEYKEFPIKHPRENIGDVLRRRLPRDAQGQLTVPALAEATMTALNAKLETYGVYLEPTEFTITAHTDKVFVLAAKNSCVIFYGKVTVANTAAVTAPLEVYEAEGTEGTEEGEDGGEGTDPEPETPPTEPPVVTITNLEYDVGSRTVMAEVTNTDTVHIQVSFGSTFSGDIAVVDGLLEYQFAEDLVDGSVITVSYGNVNASVAVSNPTP